MPFELYPQPADQGLGWFQAGAAIGARNADRRLQVQELKSREAERVVRERQIAAQLQHLDLQNQIIQQGIKEKADQDAQWADLTTQAQAVHKIISADAPSGPVDEGAPPRDIPDANEVLANMALPLAGSNPNAKKFIDTFAASNLKGEQAGLAHARAGAVATGGLASGKTPADLIKAKALEDAQTNYNNATALLEHASTDEEKAAAEATVKSADLHLKSIRAAMHVLSPEDKQIQLQTINGQTYLFRGNSAPHLVSDPVQKAKLAIAQKRLGDVEQQIGDIEASTRLKPEEQTKRLAPLLKQRDALKAVFETVKPDTTTTAPAAATAPVTTSPRVKIKDSNGKEFTIPADQLKQALDEGYTESK